MDSSMQLKFASAGVLLVPPDGGSIVDYGQHKGLEVNIKSISPHYILKCSETIKVVTCVL